MFSSNKQLLHIDAYVDIFTQRTQQIHPNEGQIKYIKEFTGKCAKDQYLNNVWKNAFLEHINVDGNPFGIIYDNLI